jgi:hypothetical protein
VRILACLLVAIGLSAFWAAFPAVADADPHRVIVLPLDGNADPAVRTKLSASLDKLAHQIDGTVTTGDTTFAETAAAVGCDATAPGCADTVMTTLSVDEIVYGTATTTNGHTTVVVRRATKGSAPQETTVATEAPDQLETGAGTLFPGKEQPPPAPLTAPPPDQPWSTDKKIGILGTAGGGALLIVGLLLWNSASDLQSQIDHHPTDSPADFKDLTSLESSASTRAGIGNFAVLLGVAGVGVGAYFLYRDYRAGSVTVTPTPVDHGAGVTIGGRW